MSLMNEVVRECEALQFDSDRRMEMEPSALPGEPVTMEMASRIAARVTLQIIRENGWLTPEAIEQLRREGL